MLEKLFSSRQLSALKILFESLKKHLKTNGIRITSGSIAVFYIVIEMFGVMLFDLAISPQGEELDLTGYELVFYDDFDGDSLDTDENWEIRAPGARRGGFNTKGDQIWVEDGNLYIRAEYIEDGDFGDGWYAGMVRTQREFIRGYFEVSCICSKGGNFWSAFWLNSRGMASAEASNGGLGGAEIDIFEAFNYRRDIIKDSVSLNIHVGGYGDGLESTGLGNFKGKNIYKEYNTYGLMWTEDEYIFYINGVEAVRSTFKDGVSQAEEYIILSLELPDEITELPGFTTDFIIDYVKVYQLPQDII